MNAITSVSKQTNMMVTKMLTWLKNEFQTSRWHHCLSVIHNLWLYTRGCWHRNHLTEKYFLLKWLSYSVDGNHRFTEQDNTAAHFPLFSEEVFSEFCCFKIFLCIHSHVKVLLISHLFTVCSSKTFQRSHWLWWEALSGFIFFSIRNG